MARHVVRSFRGVAVDPVAFGDEPAEEPLQIALHVGVRVLLDHDRRGGVADVEGQQPFVDPRTANPGADVARELVQTLAARGNREFVRALADGRLLRARSGERDHDLASRVTFFQVRNRLCDVAQFVAAVDDRRHLSRLGELAEERQVLLFQLRGMSREEFLGIVGKSAASAQPPPDPPEPLPIAASAFWNGTDVPAHTIGEVNPTITRAVLPRRLGKFPFWRGTENLLQSLDPIYQEAAARAAKTLAY